MLVVGSFQYRKNAYTHNKNFSSSKSKWKKKKKQVEWKTKFTIYTVVNVNNIWFTRGDNVKSSVYYGLRMYNMPIVLCINLYMMIFYKAMEWSSTSSSSWWWSWEKDRMVCFGNSVALGFNRHLLKWTERFKFFKLITKWWNWWNGHWGLPACLCHRIHVRARTLTYSICMDREASKLSSSAWTATLWSQLLRTLARSHHIQLNSHK